DKPLPPPPEEQESAPLSVLQDTTAVIRLNAPTANVKPLDPNSIGACINQELYKRLKGLLADSVLQDALNKAKNDPSISPTLKEQLKLLYADANQNNAVTDILDKLCDSDVKDSFDALMVYVENLTESKASSSAGGDTVLNTVSDFLATMFQDVSPLLPFGNLVFMIGKLGYNLFKNSGELETAVQDFSKTIKETTTDINIQLRTPINDSDTRLGMAESLNTLIGCVSDYFEFCMENYCLNDSGKRWNMRKLNFIKTVSLKKDFEGIKARFETAHKHLDSRIGVSILRGIANIEARVTNGPPYNHVYPLKEVAVQKFVDPTSFTSVDEVSEGWRCKNLIEEIKRVEEIPSSEKLIVHLLDPPSEKDARRKMLSKSAKLKVHLCKVERPDINPVFDYAAFTEVDVFVEGEATGVKIRITECSIVAFKKQAGVVFYFWVTCSICLSLQIENNITHLHGRVYDIAAKNSESDSTELRINSDAEVLECCQKAWKFFVQIRPPTTSPVKVESKPPSPVTVDANQEIDELQSLGPVITLGAEVPPKNESMSSLVAIGEESPVNLEDSSTWVLQHVEPKQASQQLLADLQIQDSVLFLNIRIQIFEFSLKHLREKIQEQIGNISPFELFAVSDIGASTMLLLLQRNEQIQEVYSNKHRLLLVRGANMDVHTTSDSFKLRISKFDLAELKENLESQVVALSGKVYEIWGGDPSVASSRTLLGTNNQLEAC
ncbi:UNVERIFIED_CONTAM: hypothetical protein HDU68_003880, partial [Siphonaria sp. JEL0065]